jgi:ABC-2 type transport system permease protein
MTSDAGAALRATPALMRVAWADLFAYRAEMVIWILTNILPLFMLALWDAVVRDGAIAGYGPAETGRYFVAMLVVRQLTGNWVAWELSFLIRSGNLNGQLLRPIHPLWISATWMVAALPWRVAILGPLVAAVLALRPDLLAWPGAAAIALFALSTALAWVLSFLIQSLLGALSFWIDKSDGVFGVWFAVWSLGAGYLAPTAFFPAPVQPWLRTLPLRGTLAVPVELLGGFLTPADAVFDLAVQAAWCAALWLLLARVWRAGLARYGAFGS